MALKGLHAAAGFTGAAAFIAPPCKQSPCCITNNVAVVAVVADSCTVLVA
jgi:hypothetical protein